MEVILKQDFHDLGLEGDVVDVAKGYARNYLIPQGIALAATPQNIKAMELQKRKIELRRLKAKEEAEKLKEKIDGMETVISQKAGEEGKLYGSVTSMDIASQLEKQGLSIDRKRIGLDKPIKSLGEFEIPIKIYPGVTGSVKLSVVPAEEKES